MLAARGRAWSLFKGRRPEEPIIPAVMGTRKGRVMGIIYNMKAHNPRADDLKRYAVSTLNEMQSSSVVAQRWRNKSLIFSRKLLVVKLGCSSLL